MEQKIIDKIRKKLQNLRNEILFIISEEDTPSRSKDVNDEVDQASDMVSQQMGSLMSTSFRKNLVRVDEALKRIGNGEYGKCLECGVDIAPKRLDILPLTDHCIKCQTMLEEE